MRQPSRARDLLRAAVLLDRGDGQTGDDRTTAPLSSRSTRVSIIGLHTVFGVLVALAAAVAVLDGTRGNDSGAWWALGALGVLVVSYLLAGAPALADEAPGRAVVYLLVLVAVLGMVAYNDPNLLFLFFLAYPQVWFLVERIRPGITWSVLLAASSMTGLTLAGRHGKESLVSELSNQAAGLVFSIALGIWVSFVLRQSRQRGHLIEQLEGTRAELATAHHEQGVMAERERLAREVHDTLAQGYTSIVVLAQTASAKVSSDPVAAQERLALIAEVARDNLRETRAVVAAFSPVALDGSTLVDALHRIADRFTRETGTRVEIETDVLADGRSTLRRDEEIVLLRAAQEALANTRRHAAASAVSLRLARFGDEMSISITDDGVGFTSETGLGMGLSGLRDRVEQAGGALDVMSSPGGGTQLTARVPIAAST